MRKTCERAKTLFSVFENSPKIPILQFGEQSELRLLQVKDVYLIFRAKNEIVMG